MRLGWDCLKIQSRTPVHTCQLPQCPPCGFSGWSRSTQSPKSIGIWQTRLSFPKWQGGGLQPRLQWAAISWPSGKTSWQWSEHTEKGGARSTAETQLCSAQTGPDAHITPELASFQWTLTHLVVDNTLYSMQPKAAPVFYRIKTTVGSELAYRQQNFCVSSSSLLFRYSLILSLHTRFFFLSNPNARLHIHHNLISNTAKKSESRTDNKDSHLMLKVYAQGKAFKAMCEIITG